MRKAIVGLLALFTLIYPSRIEARAYGEGAYGLGNYNEGEPTPTPSPTPSPTVAPATNSSASNSPACSDTPPSRPELFQVDVRGTSAKLFFTPLAVTSRFYVSFSTQGNAEEHGVEVTLAREGVQNYTVSGLKPNATYYFKIRGQNGCAPGDWSNIVKVTTKWPGLLRTIAYYTNNLRTKASTVVAAIKKPKQEVRAVDTTVYAPPILEVVPQQPTAGKREEAKQPERKKFCFLWWCW